LVNNFHKENKRTISNINFIHHPNTISNTSSIQSIERNCNYVHSVFNDPQNAAHSNYKNQKDLHEENRARLYYNQQTKEEKESFGHSLKTNSSLFDQIATNVNTTSNNNSNNKSDNSTITGYFSSNIISNFFSDVNNNNNNNKSKIENKAKPNFNTHHLDQSQHLETNKTIHNQAQTNHNSSSNKNSHKNEKKNDPQSATMFAAAAVAAAAHQHHQQQRHLF